MKGPPVAQSNADMYAAYQHNQSWARVPLNLWRFAIAAQSDIAKGSDIEV